MGIPYQSDYTQRYYISNEILNEIIHIKKEIDGLNLLLSLGKVVVKEPLDKQMNFILNKMKSLGQYGLSKADCSIIALSYQLKIPLMSTDYSLVNLANLLSIKTIVPGKAVFETRRSKKFCSICKKYFVIRHMYCNFCGNKLAFKKINN
jgi:rRNA maturation endonuclease Nob1